MTTAQTADALALTRYGVGQPVTRTEDPVLLRGEGRYTDDINLPGQLIGKVLRSRHAHARIGSIDVTRSGLLKLDALTRRLPKSG